jgi:hypothetical protein
MYDELRRLYMHGHTVFDAHRHASGLCKVQLMSVTSDYRGLCKITQMIAHPGVYGPCLFCELIGIHFHGAPLNTTVYRGAHRWLPPDSKRREEWEQFNPAEPYKAADPAPAERTAQSITDKGFEAEDTDDKKERAKTGFHQRSALIRALPYADPVLMF